ncbi:MAG: hypothetical protein ACRC1K_21250, partial [Planctomycetia bacterium]
AVLMLEIKGMKHDPSMLCNGMLAGLVSVTASCAFIDSWAAVLIGLVAGSLVVVCVLFVEDSGVDDPVGAISVHGVNGCWGLLALGLFANGKYGAGWNGVVRPAYVTEFGSDGVRGLLYGDLGQLLAQIINVVVVLSFGGFMAYIWFKISDKITPLRVKPEYEPGGLDIPELGAMAYHGGTGTGAGLSGTKIG